MINGTNTGAMRAWMVVIDGEMPVLIGEPVGQLFARHWASRRPVVLDCAGAVMG